MPSSSHDVADPILLYVPVCLSYTYGSSQRVSIF